MDKLKMTVEPQDLDGFANSTKLRVLQFTKRYKAMALGCYVWSITTDDDELVVTRVFLQGEIRKAKFLIMVRSSSVW